MELLISNIKEKGDIRLFRELAERLGLKTTQLSAEDTEDIRIYDEAKKNDDGYRITLTDYIKQRQQRNA